MKAFRSQDIPDAHKIAVYDALCLYFAQTLDRFYTDPTPQDPRYDSGADTNHPTECIGIEVEGGALSVVMAIQGWADTIGFSVELPVLTRNDQTDEGVWIDVTLMPPLRGRGRGL